MEFAVGRASYRSTARSFDALEPRGTKWHRFKWVTIVGNYLLMMFYTSVCGWMVAYLFKMATGTFDGTEDVAVVFSSMTGNPLEMTGWMLLVTVMGFAICAMGVQKGVERITKYMMAALFIFLAVLCVRSCLLEGGEEGRVPEQPHEVVEAVHLGPGTPQDAFGEAVILEGQHHAVHGVVAENQQIRHQRDQHEVQELVLPDSLPEGPLAGVLRLCAFVFHRSCHESSPFPCGLLPQGRSPFVTVKHILTHCEGIGYKQ